MDATVLLVMDVQRGVVDRYAGETDYLVRLTRAIADPATSRRAASRPRC